MNYKDFKETLIKKVLEKNGINGYKKYRQLIEKDLLVFVHKMEAEYRSRRLRLFFESYLNMLNEPYIRFICCNENNSEEICVHIITTSGQYKLVLEGITLESNLKLINELERLIANISWIKES